MADSTDNPYTDTLLFPYNNGTFGIHNPDNRQKTDFTTPMDLKDENAKTPCAVGIAGRCEPSRAAFTTPTLSPA